MNYLNRYIAFEGIDGCGKTTQARLFYEYIKKQNISVYLTKEPGGTSIGKNIRELLLNTDIPSKTRLFMFLADRSIHIENVKNQLKNGIVISDRSLFSTIAYQAFGDGLSLEFVQQANLFAVDNITPNLTFIIDIDIKEMDKRITNRDVIEKKGKIFFERVKNGYQYIKDHFDNVYLINGNRNIKVIAEDIIGIWKKFC